MACQSNCQDIEGLHEAGVNLIGYADKINKWLNGGQNETVTVGGTTIPTLLGLAYQIKQLVGVWPDEKTISIDSFKKIYVILQPDGGIHVGKEGLYVDSQDFLQLGGGLAKDKDGNIYVDFAEMPASRIEDVVKSMNLPVILKANRSFYVNGSKGNDADALANDGTSAHPFKTIQAAVNYATSTYNFADKIVTITIEPGLYEEAVTIGDFSVTTGRLVLKTSSGYGSGSTGYTDRVTIRHTISTGHTGSVAALMSYGADVYIQDINLEALLTSNEAYSGDDGAAFVYKGRCHFYGCNFTVQANAISSRTTSIISVISGAQANINRQNQLIAKYIRGVHIYGISCSGYLELDNVTPTANNWLRFKGDFRIVAYANSGYIYRSATQMMPMEAVGTVTGKRYQCSSGGRIHTYGGGPDYFPGDSEGTVEESTYSWYK